MGVHGLTTFIAHYQGQYKEKVYIRDKPVVIDGCNLMYYLYFDGVNSVVVKGGGGQRRKSDTPKKKLPNAHLFCGDWEVYAQNVRYFFQQLKQCGIVPVVLFDGAYNASKLEVAKDRFRQAVVDNVRRVEGNEVVFPGKTYTPIFLKTVFLEVLEEQKICHYQTIGEADSTIAFIARLLRNCPILSCDSDFYIYVNAKMIPLQSLKFAKAAPGKEQKKVMQSQEVPISPSKIWTLQGEFVSLDKLCKTEFKLQNTKYLGLAAVILGNDIIQHKVFKNFQSGAGSMGLKARTSSVMQWLAKQTSMETAITTLVEHVPEERRELVEMAIRLNLQIYDGEDGEKRIWDRLKTDIDLKEFIDHDLETKLLVDLSISQLDNLTLIEKGTLCLSSISQENFVKPGIIEINSVSVGNEKLETKLSTLTLPEWYVISHTLCNYQSYLLNLYKNQIVFLVPQVEIYGESGSHDFSIPIIQVTSGILVSDPEKQIELLTCHKGQVIKKLITPITKLDNCKVFPIIKTDEINDFSKTISHEDRSAFLLSALGLYDNQFMQGWPSSYRIWIATLSYYSRHLLESKRLELSTTLSILTSIFLCVIKNLIVNPGSVKASENKCISVISSILKDPVGLQDIRKFYQKFEDYSDVSSRKFMKSYDIRLSFCLAEYLNIVYHTEMLNNLLGEPFKGPKVRYFMNNFFVYNFANYLTGKEIGLSTGVDKLNELVKTFLDVIQ